MLAAWVEADASKDSGNTTAALAPASTDVLDAINRPVDDSTWAALESLTALLGYDPRPLDSHTCRGLVLGTAVRGAFLAMQHDAYATHLSAIGLAPSEHTLWYFALLSVRRGDREVMACIEEITALGEDRRRALERVATVRAALTDRLVLRAFLKEWPEGEARLRRDEFLEATADVLGAIRTG